MWCFRTKRPSPSLRLSLEPALSAGSASGGDSSSASASSATSASTHSLMTSPSTGGRAATRRAASARRAASLAVDGGGAADGLAAAARKAATRASLRRSSLPAIHLQAEQESAAIMRCPPVFDNPLRRRGCCDHAFSETMTQYRAEAIQRDLAAKQARHGGDPLVRCDSER